MDEVVDGLLHWSTYHEGIGQTVHSHLHVPSGVVFDPRLPEGGAHALAQAASPSEIVLSCRHHVRHAAQLADVFGCPVRVHRSAVEELTGDGLRVKGFDDDEAIGDGVTALGFGAICPDDAAFAIDAGDGALLFGDGLIRADDELAFVPDFLLGDDPEAIKRTLRDGLARLLDRGGFDTLLFAHGAPLTSGGEAALAAFLN